MNVTAISFASPLRWFDTSEPWRCRKSMKWRSSIEASHTCHVLDEGTTMVGTHADNDLVLHQVSAWLSGLRQGAQAAPPVPAFSYAPVSPPRPEPVPSPASGLSALISAT